MEGQKLEHDKNPTRFVVDFMGDSVPGLETNATVEAKVKTSKGEIRNLVTEKNEVTGGWRAFFDLVGVSSEPAELRMTLQASGRVLSETWVYHFQIPGPHFETRHEEAVIAGSATHYCSARRTCFALLVMATTALISERMFGMLQINGLTQLSWRFLFCSSFAGAHRLEFLTSIIGFIVQCLGGDSLDLSRTLAQDDTEAGRCRERLL